MTTKRPNLLPCPFCGGSAALWREDRDENPFNVRCDDCECRTDCYHAPRDAIAAWNRRAAPPADREAFNQGIEAAAQWHDEQAARSSPLQMKAELWRISTRHKAAAKAIRALKRVPEREPPKVGQ